MGTNINQGQQKGHQDVSTQRDANQYNQQNQVPNQQKPKMPQQSPPGQRGGMPSGGGSRLA